MWWKKSFIIALLVVFLFSGGVGLADRPSADITGDGFVDLADILMVASQWLSGDPNIPAGMVYIPNGGFEMGDHHDGDSPDELPLHPVLLDSFYMSKYPTTNRQYCDYLNSAKNNGEIKVESGVVYATTDNTNSYPYCDTHSANGWSQIVYSGGVFSVRTKDDRDMSDDPMVRVSWYGAVAYCNRRSGEDGKEQCYNLSTWSCDFSKKGYRLPTEAEWEYAARGGKQDPYCRFPWGDTINHDYANYYANGSAYSYDTSPYTTNTYHPKWNDGIFPYTSVVGSFSANGYGLFDMAGNVWELCNDRYDNNYYNVSPYDNPQGPAVGTTRVARGGEWHSVAFWCRSACRNYVSPGSKYHNLGFRVVLDVE